MEMKDEEFQTLRTRVDKISSELDKQSIVRAVNTKWMIIVGTVILAALGFTSFVQLPREAARAAKEKVGEDTMNKIKGLEDIADKVSTTDLVNLPIGTIISSILKPRSIENTFVNPKMWVLADGRKVSTDSKYHELIGKDRVPDLRGMFLRGMNEGRKDGKEDPDLNRTPWDPQEDALQKHGHETDAHTLQWKKGDTKELGYTSHGGADIVPAHVTKVKDANAADETRPKNVAVYFYIKIN